MLHTFLPSLRLVVVEVVTEGAMAVVVIIVAIVVVVVGVSGAPRVSK